MSIRHLPFLFAMGALLPLSSIAAQSSDSSSSEGGEKTDGEKSEEKKAPRIRKHADWVKEKERIDGFFTFYRDPVNGDTFMEIRLEQVGPEFIYFNYTLEGAALDGLRRLGTIGDNYVLSLRRRFNRIDFIRQDTAYSYDEGSTLDGQRANVLSPFLASAAIVAEDDADKRIVIKVDDLFKGRDLLRLGNQSLLGKLFGIEAGAYSKEKSHVRSLRNYADNSEIISEYVFDYPKASSAVSGRVALQHSFVRMPKPGFEPRFEDPRVGFFTARNTNLSTLDGNPARDRIYRWRLEKKDPAAALSEPVKPITYWIESTTPVEYREIIRDAVLRWNQVFESFGFKNAVRVEVQPANADWDAGDVNRNVIRWVASPVPVYAGYGPSAVNPRTGEIIGADIVLEHATVQRWLRQNQLTASATSSDAIAAALASDPDHLCSAGESLNQAAAFAAVLAQAGPGISTQLRAAAEAEIVRQGLYYLVLHEVGHTLGLTHNMMGSHYKPLDALAAADGAGLTNSVMDYPQVNLATSGRAQGAYFPTAPGPYDQWALAFAYDPALADPAARAAHVARSNEPGHAFGNDGDAMGTTGNGMDPRVIPYDLSAQPVAFATGQLDMIRAAQSQLVQRTVSDRGSWDEMRRTYELLNGMYRQNVTVVTRYVGGVYVDRSAIGQEGAAAAPFTPVSLETQKRSMKLLETYLFAPDALKVPEQLGAHLQFQRRGFDFYGRAQDAPLHGDVLGMQMGALAHLLHPGTLTRMTDSGLYGNRYSVNAMLSDLTAAIFDADIGGVVSTARQNLQVAYVTRLTGVLGAARTDSVAKGALFGQLNKIGKMMKRASGRGDQRTKTHRAYVHHLIEKALEGEK